MEIPSLRETSLASPATGLKTSSKIPKAQRSQLDPGGPPRLCRGCTSDKSPCQAFIPTAFIPTSFLLHLTRRVVQAHACRDALFTVECINHPSSWCANTDK